MSTEQLEKEVNEEIRRKRDQIIVNGLAQNGYEFETEEERHKFYGDRCRIISNADNDMCDFQVDEEHLFYFWNTLDVEITKNGFKVRYGFSPLD